MELFSPGHLLVLAIVVAVLFFGWKQLPDMARSLGRSLRIFKTEIKGMAEDDKVRDAAQHTPALGASATTTAPPAAPVVTDAPAPPAIDPVNPVTTPAANDGKPVDPTG